MGLSTSVTDRVGKSGSNKSFGPFMGFVNNNKNIK